MKRIFSILALMLLAGAVFAVTATVRADPPFRSHSLSGLPPSAVGQYALDWTRANYGVARGEPTVLLVRPVTQEVLDALGWTGVPTDGSHALVVLRGDFDTASGFKLPGWLQLQDQRFTHIALSSTWQRGTRTRSRHPAWRRFQ